MSHPSIGRSQYEANIGIKSLQQGQWAQAGVSFWHALRTLDDVDGARDPLDKRNALALLSMLFWRTGFEDLALMAVLEAIPLDKSLGNAGFLASDLMTYANVQQNLGNLDEAEATYRSILEDCLKRQDYANAASASTNLAGMLANDGYRKEAIERMQESLRYLERKAFPDTEINTRLMLVQVLAFEDHSPAEIFEAARPLLQRYSARLEPQQREVLALTLDKAAERHLPGQPAREVQEWKRREFPQLYGP